MKNTSDRLYWLRHYSSISIPSRHSPLSFSTKQQSLYSLSRFQSPSKWWTLVHRLRAGMFILCHYHCISLLKTRVSRNDCSLTELTALRVVKIWTRIVTEEREWTFTNSSVVLLAGILDLKRVGLSIRANAPSSSISLLWIAFTFYLPVSREKVDTWRICSWCSQRSFLFSRLD